MGANPTIRAKVTTKRRSCNGVWLWSATVCSGTVGSHTFCFGWAKTKKAAILDVQENIRTSYRRNLVALKELKKVLGGMR